MPSIRRVVVRPFVGALVSVLVVLAPGCRSARGPDDAPIDDPRAQGESGAASAVVEGIPADAIHPEANAVE
jgi:hypothetical protein